MLAVTHCVCIDIRSHSARELNFNLINYPCSYNHPFFGACEKCSHLIIFLFSFFYEEACIFCTHFNGKRHIGESTSVWIIWYYTAIFPQLDPHSFSLFLDGYTKTRYRASLWFFLFFCSKFLVAEHSFVSVFKAENNAFSRCVW